MRNIWGVSAVILFLGFISKFECEFIRNLSKEILIQIFNFIAGAKRFLNWHVFNPLGRLTYIIYICHLSISRVIFGRENNLASFSYPVFVSSEIFSILLKLLVYAYL